MKALFYLLETTAYLFVNFNGQQVWYDLKSFGQPTIVGQPTEPGTPVFTLKIDDSLSDKVLTPADFFAALTPETVEVIGEGDFDATATKATFDRGEEYQSLWIMDQFATVGLLTVEKVNERSREPESYSILAAKSIIDKLHQSFGCEYCEPDQKALFDGKVKIYLVIRRGKDSFQPSPEHTLYEWDPVESTVDAPKFGFVIVACPEDKSPVPEGYGYARNPIDSASFSSRLESKKTCLGKNTLKGKPVYTDGQKLWYHSDRLTIYP